MSRATNIGLVCRRHYAGYMSQVMTAPLQLNEREVLDSGQFLHSDPILILEKWKFIAFSTRPSLHQPGLK